MFLYLTDLDILKKLENVFYFNTELGVWSEMYLSAENGQTEVHLYYNPRDASNCSGKLFIR